MCSGVLGRNAGIFLGIEQTSLVSPTCFETFLIIAELDSNVTCSSQHNQSYHLFKSLLSKHAHLLILNAGCDYEACGLTSDF